MTLDYNIYLELAVIPLNLILYVYVLMRYKDMTPVNIAFRRLSFIVLIADAVDVITAVVTSAHDMVPNAVHYIFNITDSILTSLLAFAFIYYVYACSPTSPESLARRNKINCALFVINAALLITNPVTGWVFTYDAGGNYIHNTLFVPVAYGFPILFFAIGSIYMMTHREGFKKDQVVALMIVIPVAAVLFILQMMFFDDVLITLFIASLGVLAIFLSIENPERMQLLQTRAELKQAKEREAAALAREKLSQQILFALSKTVDAKDHYTNGHSVRVAQYAKEIVARMGKSEKEQEEIYELGLLHDIGKIGIPRNIINKTGKLTPEEFDEIKKHTIIGWDILKTMDELPWLSTGARWHHERFDGKGYPDGLAGKDIPEEARILCLADSYDAMTSKRSYSSPRSQEEVRAEIVRCMGTQFDPDIAKYMLEMIDEDKEYRLREIPVQNQ